MLHFRFSVIPSIPIQSSRYSVHTHSTSYNLRSQQELCDGICISGVDEKKVTGALSFRCSEVQNKGTLSLLFLHTCLAVIPIMHKSKYCIDLITTNSYLFSYLFITTFYSATRSVSQTICPILSDT